jgi:hypothetical protein
LVSSLLAFCVVPPDFVALVSRDHDDLDRALVAMVTPETKTEELSELLDSLRLALAIHVAAEDKVMRVVLLHHDTPALRDLVVRSRNEHRRHQASADALCGLRPGTEPWCASVLELRVAVLEHASRAELVRWTLAQHLTRGRGRTLAADYATERFRTLGETSPVALAHEALRDVRIAAEPRRACRETPRENFDR